MIESWAKVELYEVPTSFDLYPSQEDPSEVPPLPGHVGYSTYRIDGRRFVFAGYDHTRGIAYLRDITEDPAAQQAAERNADLDASDEDD